MKNKIKNIIFYILIGLGILAFTVFTTYLDREAGKNIENLTKK